MELRRKSRPETFPANALEASSIAHFVIGKDHTIVEWNRACEILTGQRSRDMIGTKGQWKPFFPSARPCLCDFVLDGASERTIRSCYKGMTVRKLPEQAVEVEAFFAPLGNEGRWLKATAAAVRNPRMGGVEWVIETLEDITERKQAEQEMARLNRELLKTNKRLRELALRDPHTGLYNHRYLEEALDVEITRSRRYEQPLSLIMLDVDYFKSINDVYGHPFGDLILQQLAQQLKKLVRRYDIVGRYGGEEFVIISPGVDRFQTIIQAQRILDEIGLYSFGNKTHEVRIKLSMAVVSYPEEKIAAPMDLVDLADMIMDKAKEDGGNRVYSSFDVKGRLAVKRRKRPENVVSLRHKLGKVTKQANQSLVESIFAFAKTIEIKDHYTGEHVERTVEYATRLARMLGYPSEMIDAVKQAAILHDLGKIGISDHILLKDSKLSAEEYDEIKKHPQIAADILRPIKFLHKIIPFILYHHERWDGKGYPAGLKGENIPAGARIISVADVYQALTSNRPYRKAFSRDEAIKILRDGAGSQFDPKIVRIFLKLLKTKK
ncbi:MAG: diguanylate cyclase [Deltaproteobacteria bacterium]